MGKNRYYLFFSIIGAGIVLWRMLLSGYVLTLDMVFGPHRALPLWTGLMGAAAPMKYLFWALNAMLGGMILQKIILVGIFFSLFYFPLRYWPWARGHGQEYVASLFFAINPFVYERLLAGQWGILAAYSLLWPLAYGLIRRDVVLTFGSMLVMGMFSLHLLTISVIVCAIYALVALRGEYLKKFLIGAGVFALVSLYWVIPYLMTRDQSPLVVFDAPQWQAFVTASDPHLGTLGNVASLYGFWGEHEYWATQFIFSQGHFVRWVISLAALGGVVWGGLVAMLADRSKRKAGLFMLGIGVLALVFSSGVAASPVHSVNDWLFNHIGFWRGFRDSQKWSALLATIYALLAGNAAGWLGERIKSSRVRVVAMVALCLVPLAYMYPMLLGYAGQLRPVQYPTEWAQADAILGQDPQCKALFLPWHQYYTLPWNHGLLTTNPAPSYFTCQIISGKNMELGDIEGVSVQGADYEALETAITANLADPEMVIDLLRSQGITYIISSGDIADEDQFSYPFLKSPQLTRVFVGKDLQLYQISGIIN